MLLDPQGTWEQRRARLSLRQRSPSHPLSAPGALGPCQPASLLAILLHVRGDTSRCCPGGQGQAPVADLVGVTLPTSPREKMQREGVLYFSPRWDNQAQKAPQAPPRTRSPSLPFRLSQISASGPKSAFPTSPGGCTHGVRTTVLEGSGEVERVPTLPSWGGTRASHARVLPKLRGSYRFSGVCGFLCTGLSPPCF